MSFAFDKSGMFLFWCDEVKLEKNRDTDFKLSDIQIKLFELSINFKNNILTW